MTYCADEDLAKYSRMMDTLFASEIPRLAGIDRLLNRVYNKAWGIAQELLPITEDFGEIWFWNDLAREVASEAVDYAPEDMKRQWAYEEVPPAVLFQHLTGEKNWSVDKSYQEIYDVVLFNRVVHGVQEIFKVLECVQFSEYVERDDDCA